MLAMFSPIFVADTKVTFIYNFIAPLKFKIWLFCFGAHFSHPAANE